MGETGGRKSKEESWGRGKSKIISKNSRGSMKISGKIRIEGGNPQEESRGGGSRKPLEKSVRIGKHEGGVEDSRRILEGTKGNPGESREIEGQSMEISGRIRIEKGNPEEFEKNWQETSGGIRKW